MSKELEALENIECNCELYDFKYEDFERIRKALKALEVIKQNILKITPFEEYGCTCIYIAKPKKEEYDLLKEELL